MSSVRSGSIGVPSANHSDPERIKLQKSSTTNTRCAWLATVVPSASTTRSQKLSRPRLLS
jgi:hypothetical protein